MKVIKRKVQSYRSFRIWLATEYNVSKYRMPGTSSILSIKHLSPTLSDVETNALLRNYTQRTERWLKHKALADANKITTNEIARAYVELLLQA